MNTFARRLLLIWLCSSFVLGALYISRTGGFDEFLRASATEQLKLFAVLPMVPVIRLFTTGPVAAVSIGEAWIIVVVLGVFVLALDSFVPQFRSLSVPGVLTSALFLLAIPSGFLAIASAFRQSGSSDVVFWLGAGMTFAGLRDQSSASKFPAVRALGWLLLVLATLLMYQVILAEIVGAKLGFAASTRELFVFCAGTIALARPMIGPIRLSC